MHLRSPIASFAVLALLGVPSAAAAADARVDFRSNEYAPKSVRIKPGESVTWAPVSGESFDDHPLSSDPGEREAYRQDKGTQPFTRSFATAGRYRFYCTFHGAPEGLGMAGSIIVSANTAHTAAFTVDGTRAAEGAFAFDATGPGGSSDPDMGQSLSYVWDFGDGASATTATPSHAYPPAGPNARTYEVRLTVTDDNRDSTGAARSTAVRQVTVPAASGASSAASPTAATPSDGGTTSAGAAPGGSAPVTSPARPGVTFALGKLPAVQTLLRRGLPVGVTSRTDARATATLRVAGRTVARAPSTAVTAGARRTLRLRFTQPAR